MERWVGLLFFFGVLFGADRSLARWGSGAIRTRPRPGGRVTLVFAAVIGSYTILGIVAQSVASMSAPLAWLVVVVAVPVCALVAVGTDRLAGGR